MGSSASGPHRPRTSRASDGTSSTSWSRLSSTPSSRASAGSRPASGPTAARALRPPTTDRMTGGRLFTGTSGFSYPAWAPRFYPPGTRSADLLREYSARLAACELNNTFYARPTVERIRGWIEATPESFRFVVKGQRGASLRALGTGASESVRWLLEPLPAFGERLGAVLFRVPDPVGRDDDRLAALLRAWPRDVP